MRLTIEPTQRQIEVYPEGYVQGRDKDQRPVRVRIWEGTTESGYKVQMLVCRAGLDLKAPQEAHRSFGEALRITDDPSTMPKAYDLRLFL